MADEEIHQDANQDGFGWKKTALISALILLGGAAITYYIFSSEPTAERTGATKQTAMLVEVTRVDSGTFRPTIVAMGTVRPAQDIILRPQVSGEIIERAENFTPGGFVDKGDTLLRIEPSDYNNALQQRKSELHQAVANLKLEMGRQEIAREEYNLLEEELSPTNRALVLREPQLNAARSNVESARAAVEQAELELRRTYIKAPFDAHIVDRTANIGSQVSPGENLAYLAGLNTYWVEAMVPLAKLQWLSIPDSPDTSGTKVLIRNRTAWPEDTFRTGHLHQLIGQIEGQTRMARVLVSVDDPLAQKVASSEVPPLMIGAYVETHINGKEISNAVRLSRDYVRKNNTVWVMQDSTLDIRDVEIAFQDENYAYITDGLQHNEQVVTTNLSTVVDGVKLRLESAAGSTN